MATVTTAIPAPAKPGLLDAIRSFLAAWVDLLKTRIEIVSTEIEEAKERLEQMVLLAVVSLFCLSFGILLLTLFVVIVFWETHRQVVLGGFAGFYLLAGVASALALRKKIKSKSKLFSTTVAELAKDQRQLEAKRA